jgi:phosphoglycolate phosphatase
MRLIFDLDGTLYMTEHTIMTAVRSLFQELGLPEPDEKAVLRHIGKTMPRFMTCILPQEHVTEAVTQRLHALEYDAVRTSGRLFPYVREILRELRQTGHRLSVCSNGSEAYIRLVLSCTDAEACFDDLCSARDYPDKAAKIKEMLIPGESTVVVGDAPDDLAAAAENSVPSIAALYGYGGADPEAATLTAHSARELLSCVRRLDVFDGIEKRLLRQGKRFIGISGIDTSGKTAFSEAFARYLRSIGRKCLVIHMDDFHNPLALRRQGSDEIDAYYQNAFNYSQLTGEILEPLQNTGRLDKDVLCLNLDTDRYEILRHFDADPDTVVLLEGVLLFRPPVSEYLDGKVFLHIDFDEMLERARVRDVPKYGAAFLEKYKSKYIPVQQRYIKEHRPHETCDILIDNSNYLFPLIKDMAK